MSIALPSLSSNSEFGSWSGNALIPLPLPLSDDDDASDALSDALSEDFAVLISNDGSTERMGTGGVSLVLVESVSAESAAALIRGLMKSGLVILLLVIVLVLY